jgi:hypothetical protein
LATEPRPRAIGEFDAVDRAIAANEIKRPRAPARADELADAEILWGPVEEDDPEIQELDIVAGASSAIFSKRPSRRPTRMTSRSTPKPTCCWPSSSQFSRSRTCSA